MGEILGEIMEKLKPTLKFRNLRVKGRFPNWKLDGESADTRFSRADGSLAWHGFIADFQLMAIRQAMRSRAAATKIWAQQDGMPGLSPDECDWDWSAIRDSSHGAIKEMYSIATKYLDMDSFKKSIKRARL